jgi:hypothetical protein
MRETMAAPKRTLRAREAFGGAGRICEEGPWEALRMER